MKIAFIVGSAAISGGTNVIFEHAIRINNRGKLQVHIVMENELDLEDLFWHPGAKNLNWLTFKDAEKIMFDAVIATWWVTTFESFRLKSKAYLYFNQSVESKFYRADNIIDRKYADSTYFLGLNVITEATWIQKYLRNKYQIDSELVLNGIRKDIYKVDGSSIAPRDPDKLRVLVEGPLGVFFKNTEKTIELCLKSKADEVWLMTSSDINDYKGVDKVISRVPIEKTSEVYRSCDVVVKLSYVEGMFGPPLEMFHCGGTAIVYDVTGHDEYIRHNFNGLIVKTDDEEQVIKNLNFLKENPEEVERLKKGALDTANLWIDWDESSKYFEDALLKSMRKNQMSQTQLRERTLHFKEWYEYSLRNKNSKKNIFLKKIKKVISFFIRGRLRVFLVKIYRK